jgi:hypothetical protein
MPFSSFWKPWTFWKPWNISLPSTHFNEGKK